MSITTLKSPALHQTHWSATTARSLLAAQAASGETVTAFARRHGLHPQRLFWWRKQLEGWGIEHKTAPRLVPVVAVARPAGRGAPSGVSAVEPPSPTVASPEVPQITLRFGEVTLEIADAALVPPTWLAALVQELRR